MENKIEYVLYESEKNNEFINRLKPIHSAVKKIKKTEKGVIMEEFYDFSNYKNVRSLEDLSQSLNENEYLIIDLNEIKKEDERLPEQFKLYEKIKETIDINHIIEYIYHDSKKVERPIGEKLYLIKYDDEQVNIINAKQYPLVKVQMHLDETCDWQEIRFTSKHKKEIDEELYYYNGGYSGLYYLIPEKSLDDINEYCEITKIENGKWDFIKKYKGKNK